MSLPPDPPHVNNNNYICLKYCPKGLDHLNGDYHAPNYYKIEVGEGQTFYCEQFKTYIAY